MSYTLQIRKLKRLIAVLLLVHLGLLGYIYWLHQHAHGPALFPKPEAYRDLTPILTRELGLSAQQAQQLDSLRLRYFRREVRLKMAIKAHKDSMNVEMFDVQPNSERLQLRAQAIAQMEFDMELLRLDQAREFQLICTPQQRSKLKALVLEIRDYFRPDNQPNRS